MTQHFSLWFFPLLKIKSLLWKLILCYLGPGDPGDRQKGFISLTEPMLEKMSVLWSTSVFPSTMPTILYCSYLKFFVDSCICGPTDYKCIHSWFFLVFFTELFCVLMPIELWKRQDVFSENHLILRTVFDSQVVFSYTAFTFLHN